MKKKLLLLLVIISLAVIFLPGAVQAAGGITAEKTFVQVSFPDSINFIVTVHSDVNITDIRLNYTVDRMEYAKIISEIFVPVSPAKTLTPQYILDMKKTGGFPPGTVLNYWWAITDAAGKRLVTEPQKINFNDERYEWKTLQQGMVTLYWYGGDSDFAGKLMDAAQGALGRLSENTGAELKSAVRLYIYKTYDDLKGAMIYPQDWTGGVAYSQYGVIAIGITPEDSSIAWGIGAISHELTHLVVHQVTGNPYNDIPTWLDEGLAMYSEGTLDPSFSSFLTAAVDSKSLISVRSLTSPFSALADQSYLGYAESYSIVAYLIDNYGRDKMKEMLGLFSRGSGYDEALSKVYGVNMDSLNTQWQASLSGSSTP
jgi:hypothetical protein